MNHDMDELFRKAGEDYPLDTSGADWEKIAKELHPAVPEHSSSRGSGKKRFLWLLLLIPFGLICNQYFTADQPTHPAGGEASSKKDLAKTAKANGNLPELLEATKETPDNQESSQPVETELSKGRPHKNLGHSAISVEKSDAYTVPSSKGSAPRPRTERPMWSVAGQDAGETPLLKKMPYAVLPTRQNKALQHTSLDASHQPITPLAMQNTRAGLTRKKRFYAGLFAGLDATRVDFQKVNHAGNDFGLLVGYQFGKRWSVETGVFVDRKYYYSKGEYLNTKKISYNPPNSKITDVWGDCRMLELPLIVKYNFASSNHSEWFSTVGLSSYIMNKEDYDYKYYYANSGTSAVHNYTYNNASKNLFSVMQFSAGYSRKIGKSTDLRLEPYVKIPLSGLGYGELRFWSTGMHVGVTRKLF